MITTIDRLSTRSKIINKIYELGKSSVDEETDKKVADLGLLLDEVCIHNDDDSIKNSAFVLGLDSYLVKW